MIDIIFLFAAWNQPEEDCIILQHPDPNGPLYMDGSVHCSSGCHPGIHGHQQGLQGDAKHGEKVEVVGNRINGG